MKYVVNFLLIVIAIYIFSLLESAGKISTLGYYAATISTSLILCFLLKTYE